MRQDKKLSLLMGMFFVFVFVCFSLIIVDEKKYMVFLPRIDKKLTAYLKDKYSKLDVSHDKTFYENGTYKMKVKSKENKDLYFFINYKDKKITDTYKKDYLEGKTLLDKVRNDLKIKVFKETNFNTIIKMNKTLNDYSDKVQKRIIEEDNVINLRVYDSYIDIEVKSLDKDTIYNKIVKVENKFNKNDINPKNYNFTITDKNDITKSIKINNISSNIEKDELKLIINDIMDNKKSDILNKYNITYKYLN